MLSHCESSSQRKRDLCTTVCWAAPSCSSCRLYKINIECVALLRLHTGSEFLFGWCERWCQLDRNRWGLKERCRSNTRRNHNDHHLLSPQGETHNQCQYGWSSMRVGWRVNSHHGHQKGRVIESVVVVCCHTSLQDGFEPDPLESFVIENNCQGKVYILLRTLLYSNSSNKSCDHHSYTGQHRHTGHFTAWDQGSILGMQCN